MKKERQEKYRQLASRRTGNYYELDMLIRQNYASMYNIIAATALFSSATFK